MNVMNIRVLYQQINFRLRGFPTDNDVMVCPIQLFTELVFYFLNTCIWNNCTISFFDGIRPK